MSGVDLIAAERQRQIDAEGWTPEHDDDHSQGEIARAAAVYALPARERGSIPRIFGRWVHDAMYADVWRDGIWPWPGAFKATPDDRIRELVKAGALIAAEIDRLQRAPASSPGQETRL